MKCSKCHTDNPEDTKYCIKCSNVLEINQETPSKYNLQSYTPKFLADKILSNKNAVEGERKLVTVLFADVSGFTAMSSKHDPEQVHQIMDGCFKILMDEIHGHHGTINQFTGDGIMALFGAPLALEDHAKKACQAALSIQRAMNEYSNALKKNHGLTFQMRIGLNSGPVVVGSIGDDLRMDYTAVGDTTNLAARMEQIAEPGTIMISPNTYKMVHLDFKFKSTGNVTVKGKKEPLEVHALLDKTDQPQTGVERQVFSEMVGRDKELNNLEIQVLKAINGQGSVVNIIGEAGIGKSRLMAELKKRDIMKQITLLEGRAISMGRNLSFYPIIDLLKYWAQIDEKDGEATALGKLETAIRRVYPEAASEILPFVATLMGMKLSGRYAERIEGIEGEALEKLILKNTRELLSKATEMSPIMIVMEDLHWADTSSIELLASLFRLAETHRIIFINLFRPFHEDTSNQIIDTIKERLSVYYVEIALNPLDDNMGEALINNMLNIKGLYHDIQDKIIQRSGGNPFFIEEVVRSFIDAGAVVKKNEIFEVTNKINTMVIPQTINDVLMARIDRLEETTRNLVKVASVIGRNFFYRILTEVTTTIKNINNRLDYLKEIQLIRERWRMEEIEYLFKHALAQEAAYESILLQKRKELHLKVADSIEKVFKERLHEFYGMMAFHYSKGENLDKAEEYMIKAGEEALKSSASSEALHYYHEALTLYLKMYGDSADPEKIAMMEKNIALALFNRGRALEAQKYFYKVLAYYGEGEIKYSLLGILRFFKSFLFYIAGLYLPFMRWEKKPSGRDNEILYLLYKKNHGLITAGDNKKFFFETISQSKWIITYDIAEIKEGINYFGGYSTTFALTGLSFRLSRKILEIVKAKVKNDDVRSMLVYDLYLKMYYYLSGNQLIENRYDDNLVNQNLKMGEFQLTSSYVYFHFVIIAEQGCYTDSFDLINKLSETGNLFEHEYSIIQKYIAHVTLLIKYRKIQDALVELNEGISFIKKTDFDGYLFSILALKARQQYIMGDVQGMGNTLHTADKIKLKLDPPPVFKQVFLLNNFIIDLFQLEESIKTNNTSKITENKIRAIKSGKKAIKNSQKVAFDRIETYKLMGIYYWSINKQRKALKWWRRSITEGERLGARLELSRTYFEVGKRLLESKSKYDSLNSIKAQEYLEKARAMFEEMDLQWDLDELERTGDR